MYCCYLLLNYRNDLNATYNIYYTHHNPKDAFNVFFLCASIIHLKFPNIIYNGIRYYKI